MRRQLIDFVKGIYIKNDDDPTENGYMSVAMLTNYFCHFTTHFQHIHGDVRPVGS